MPQELRAQPYFTQNVDLEAIREKCEKMREFKQLSRLQSFKLIKLFIMT